LFVAAVREGADDDGTALIATRNLRLQSIAEAYIWLLARDPRASGGDAASETFALADTIRGQSVQNALTASTARMSAKDPALAELIRQEQDLAKQVNAQLGVLNNALSLPAGERDETVVKALHVAIAKARSEREKARGEIGRRFPAYQDLVDPKPPTVEGVKAVLRDDEALLSFYFGRDASFAWAVPKQGAVAFARIPLTAGELETKVRKLQEGLNLNVSTIGQIPQFDVVGAYDLYRQLLEPVQAGWRSAKSLIVVTNGALGLLPVSLLPTAPVNPPTAEEVMFSSYRQVPWLVRTHAVTTVPSAAALRSLRQQPPGSTDREPIIGFGDPYFNAEQAAEAEQQVPATAPVKVAELTARNVPFQRRSSPATTKVDSADLAQLPRLPDTGDELKSISLSVGADPSKIIYLGKSANERNVKQTDLSRFRIVAFATHGLVPGDLDGLTQPALALTAPHVADVDGDGLLTMEEVLPLKLDADWVVLSACNTAAGAVSGAEAVSGLGRAFFYAGSRALLVTNWPVHSVSARELVTDIFRRQASRADLTRAEALRQAMVGVMDGPGFVEGDKTIYTYAHPAFWAPYALVGDGGGL
jgi:CHAT domain-containing protein